MEKKSFVDPSLPSTSAPPKAVDVNDSSSQQGPALNNNRSPRDLVVRFARATAIRHPVK